MLLHGLQEPEFFSKRGQCSHRNSSVSWGCDTALTKKYLEGTLKRDFVVESVLSRAAFEASAEYAAVRHGTDGAPSVTMLMVLWVLMGVDRCWCVCCCRWLQIQLWAFDERCLG